MQQACEPAGRANKIVIPGPSGKLEGIIDCPPSGKMKAAAIICHPHPLYGGTMQNKVVHTLAKTFTAESIASIRFNFRGVGASDGTYDEGNGELEDARAVASWIMDRYPGLPLVVAGFSFGAFIALKLAAELVPAALVTVAPPVRMFDFEGAGTVECPWLLLAGEEDEIVDVNSVINWVSTLQSQPNLQIIANGSHFFHGKLIELRHLTTDFLQANDSPGSTGNE